MKRIIYPFFLSIYLMLQSCLFDNTSKDSSDSIKVDGKWLETVGVIQQDGTKKRVEYHFLEKGSYVKYTRTYEQISTNGWSQISIDSTTGGNDYYEIENSIIKLIETEEKIVNGEKLVQTKEHWLNGDLKGDVLKLSDGITATGGYSSIEGLWLNQLIIPDTSGYKDMFSIEFTKDGRYVKDVSEDNKEELRYFVVGNIIRFYEHNKENIVKEMKFQIKEERIVLYDPNQTEFMRIGGL